MIENLEVELGNYCNSGPGIKVLYRAEVHVLKVEASGYNGIMMKVRCPSGTIQCSPLHSNPLKMNFCLIQILSDSLHRHKFELVFSLN